MRCRISRISVRKYATPINGDAQIVVRRRNESIKCPFSASIIVREKHHRIISRPPALIVGHERVLEHSLLDVVHSVEAEMVLLCTSTREQRSFSFEFDAHGTHPRLRRASPPRMYERPVRQTQSRAAEFVNAFRSTTRCGANITFNTCNHLLRQLEQLASFYDNIDTAAQQCHVSLAYCTK